MTWALELIGIHKRFGRTQANCGVDLKVATGTVHAVVGENGAGKSTLLKIAYGLVRADAGSVRLRGEAIALERHRPAEALARGVGMVHQHFMLVGTLTVAENLFLGHERTRRGLLDLAGAEREIAALADRLNMPIDPRQRLADLSVGDQQRVEILRVLWLGASVLILDEPTAVLTPGEVKLLFEVPRKLVAEGKTVVIVTHKLDEVHAIADRVTVMRQGLVVAELAGDAAPETIAAAMIGRAIAGNAEQHSAIERSGMERRGEVVLAVESLRVVDPASGKDALASVSFEVRAGEILGFAGVLGNGQTELVLALSGLVKAASGALLWTQGQGRQDLVATTTRERQRLGLAVVHEDRQSHGLVLDMSISENLHLGRLDEVSAPGRLDRRLMSARADAMIADFGVTPADPNAQVRGLSGGNQQKLVMARELGRPGLKCLVCAQPTRGVDIGAIEILHRQLRAARDRGVAIVLVSAELSELRALADWVAVLYRGRIVAVVAGALFGDPAQLERIGGLMTGATP